MKQDQDNRIARNPESNEQADDVATLYSWANLHGAKYRDFSASRQEMRAQMRQRTLADRARVAREEAKKAPPALGESPRWEDLLPANGRQTAAPAPVRHEFPGERRLENPEEAERMRGILPAPAEPVSSTRHGLAGAPYFREEGAAEQRPMDRRTDPETAGVRPAWLAEVGPPAAAPIAHAAIPAPPPAAPIPPAAAPISGAESLQQSRERVASRWYALRGVFGRSQEELQPARMEGQVAALAVFSLAGGVGKTSLVAGIGRALAARGERVLLTDTCSFGVLPFYFGAREIKPGVVRTFSGGTSDPAIRVLTLDADRYDADPDLLRREMARGAQDVSRVLIDVATGSAGMLRQALRLSPVVLVPVVPDMASVVTLQALEGFFRNQEGLSGKPLQAWFVLNQFDPSSPLQLDVREVLRQQLGERLLPFAIHRSVAMSEALAEGMTIIDYAPNSPAAEDIMSLVTWIRNISVAVGSGHRGMRWSER
jgi:cellulose synthase operon protein YhjQ